MNCGGGAHVALDGWGTTASNRAPPFQNRAADSRRRQSSGLHIVRAPPVHPRHSVGAAALALHYLPPYWDPREPLDLRSEPGPMTSVKLSSPCLAARGVLRAFEAWASTLRRVPDRPSDNACEVGRRSAGSPPALTDAARARWSPAGWLGLGVLRAADDAACGPGNTSGPRSPGARHQANYNAECEPRRGWKASQHNGQRIDIAPMNCAMVTR